MAEFIDKLYTQRELSLERGATKLSENEAIIAKIFQQLPESLASRLGIHSSQIQLVTISTDEYRPEFVITIDGIFFKIYPKKHHSPFMGDFSPFCMCMWYFNSYKLKWDKIELGAYYNLSLDNIANAIFSRFSLSELNVVIAISQAVYQTNCKWVAIMIKLKHKFGMEDVVKLEESNNDKSYHYRWVFRVGNRIVAYYFSDEQEYDSEGEYRYYISGNYHLVGYTRKRKSIHTIVSNMPFYNFESVEPFDYINSEFVDTNPNVVFSAEEVMQVLGLEPTEIPTLVTAE